jgi:transcriptional regulator with XRE-family HTH domain
VTADPDAGFGDFLLAFGLAAGLTKQELAARAGVCEESVARYEDGRDASAGRCSGRTPRGE